MTNTLSLAVFAQLSFVTDRQTDGQTDTCTIAKTTLMLRAIALASVAITLTIILPDVEWVLNRFQPPINSRDCRIEPLSVWRDLISQLRVALLSHDLLLPARKRYASIPF